jgi:hypothetical protein
MQLRHRAGTRARALSAALLLLVALPATAGAAHPNPPIPYIALTEAVTTAGGQVIPLINSGDEVGGVTFQGIPDGIGVMPVGDGTGWVDLFVNHEQSHVPFGGFADFEDSSVSRVRVDLSTKQVVELEVALSPELGFIRFCSSFMAGPDEGFSDYTLFTNEESNDWIDVPAGAPYGADPAIAPYRQAGYSVMLDPSTGNVETLSRAGRLNHENLVFVPGGWKGFAALTGDDTFSAPSSQMYLYTAANEKQVRGDKGQLWAFQVTSKNGVAVDPYDAFNHANDYLDVAAGDSVAGRFIHVPNDVARGVTDEAPQDALENWSNANNVFQFVRIEDIDYDPDQPNVVYFADTGTTRLAESATTGRLERLGSGGTSSNGRIFKMVLDPKDPRRVTSMTSVVEANDIGMRNPDNLDVGHSSIMIQEDTSNAKVWRHDLASGTSTIVAAVTHPIDPAAGESSGIVDMSEWLGAGWWALDVQSHVNLDVDETVRSYTNRATGEVLTYRERLEDGQLLLMYLPGS